MASREQKLYSYSKYSTAFKRMSSALCVDGPQFKETSSFTQCQYLQKKNNNSDVKLMYQTPIIYVHCYYSVISLLQRTFSDYYATVI